MKKVLIMAGFEGKKERVALECKTKKEAVARLNKAFQRVNDNLWIDSFKQEFSITETE